MALSSSVQAPIAERVKSLNPGDLVPSILWSLFLTAVVVGPWLGPGYLFGTDWPGPRRIDFPTEVSSSAGLQVVLALSSHAIGGEATGKLLVAGSLFAAGALAYRAVPTRGFVAGALAATVYEVNPFVYGRLHYGQLYLLAGYAVLPWVTSRFRRLLQDPTPAAAIVAGATLTLLGILSLHLLFASTVVLAALVIAYFVGTKKRVEYLAKLIPSLVMTGGITLAASSYWIIPLLRGSGSEGSKLAGISGGDIAAFATVPDQRYGLIPNLLGLYGFWAEATNRFTAMKAFATLWPEALGCLLLISLIGVVAALVQRRNRLAPWAAGLLAAAAVALILEMGVSHPATAGLVRWLDANIPLYKGMRDAGKWAAILALAYSQLGALGADVIMGWIAARIRFAAAREWAGSLAAGLLLALALYYGNGLLFGAHGEIRPSAYPAGWYAADRVLSSDPKPDRTLFLPWHEYMSYSFIQNQNKIVASPAPEFFSVPILASQNPEVHGIPPPTDPDQVAITALVRASGEGNWAQVLAGLHVKYVLVAKEFDWESYLYLDHRPGLVRIGDYGAIVLYRNSLLN